MKLSILLDGESIRLCQGVYTSGKLKLKAFSTYPLTQNAVSNGILRDPDAVLSDLKKALKEGGYKAKEAMLTLCSTAISFRELTLPRANPKDMIHLVRNELQTAIGISADTVVDYTSLGLADKKTERVLAIAVQKPLVQSYFDLLRGAGLKPISMEICPSALSKALLLYPESESKGDVVVLHIGSDVLTTSLLHDTQIVFTRLSRLSSGQTPFGFDPTRRMDEIADSVSKMIQFQTAHSPGQSVQKILLSGNLSDLSELPDTISHLVSVPCQPFPASEKIISNKELPTAVYAGALGALIARR